MSDRVARLIEGCDRISWRSWPGAPDVTIGVRVLSESEWSATIAEARASVPRRPNAREHDYVAAKAERRAIVGRCIVVRDGDAIRPLLADEDLDAIDSSTAADLFDAIVRVRDEAHGVGDWTSQREVFDEIDRVYDRARVRGAAMRLRAKLAGLCGFYGVTDARRLTDWQVLIYARLARETEDDE